MRLKEKLNKIKESKVADKRSIRFVKSNAEVKCSFCDNKQKGYYEITRSDGIKYSLCVTHAGSWALKNKMILPPMEMDIEEPKRKTTIHQKGNYVISLEAKTNVLNMCMIEEIKQIYEESGIQFDIIKCDFKKQENNQ